MDNKVILYADTGDEQPRAWLDESMRSAKAEIEATPAQLRREPGDTKANAEPFAQQPARDPLCLEAENGRLLREQAEFTGAALCALGLNRDEYVSPGNQVLDEINRLTTKASELTRLLAEAEEAIREAPIETDGSGCYKGRANDWFDRPFVQRALKGALR